MADSPIRSSDEAPARSSAEPRGMTIADMLVFTTGVGIAIAIMMPTRQAAGALGFFTIEFPCPILVVFAMSCVAVPVEFGITLVSFARQIVFKRPSRAAEWLAIFEIAFFIKVMLLDLDTAVNQTFGRGSLAISIAARRYVLGGVALDVLIGGFCGLAQWANRLPHWAKTLTLAAMALAGLWVMDVGSAEFNRLVQDASGQQSGLLRSLFVNACLSAAGLPKWLLLGVPAVAALVERRDGRRRWVWTEWVGFGAVAVSELVVFILSLYFLWSDGGLSNDETAQRILLPFLIVAIGAISWLIVLRWRRFAAWRGAGPL